MGDSTAEMRFAVVNPADVLVIDAQSPEQAVAEIAEPVAAFTRDERTSCGIRPKLLRPQCPP